MAEKRSFEEVVQEQLAKILVQWEADKRAGKIMRNVYGNRDFPVICYRLLKGYSIDSVSEWTIKRGNPVSVIALKGHLLWRKNWYADIRSLGERIQNKEISDILFAKSAEEVTRERIAEEIEKGIHPDEAHIEFKPELEAKTIEADKPFEQRLREFIQGEYAVTPQEQMQGKVPKRVRLTPNIDEDTPEPQKWGNRDLLSSKINMGKAQLRLAKEEALLKLKADEDERKHREWQEEHGCLDAWAKYQQSQGIALSELELKAHWIPPLSKNGRKIEVTEEEKQAAILDLQKRGLWQRMRGHIRKEPKKPAPPAEPGDTTGGNSQA